LLTSKTKIALDRADGDEARTCRSGNEVTAVNPRESRRARSQPAIARQSQFGRLLWQGIASFLRSIPPAESEYPRRPARYHPARDFDRLRSGYNRVMLFDAAWSYAGRQAEGQRLIFLLQGMKRIRARPMGCARRVGTLTWLPLGYEST